MKNEDVLADLNIQQFNLTSGESIIGLVKSVEGNMVIVEKPLEIARTVHNGLDAHFFSAYMPLSETKIIKINYNNIVAVGDVTSDVKEKYIRACLTADDDSDFEDAEDDLDDQALEIPNAIFNIKSGKIYH